MATDYGQQRRHKEAERTVHVGLRFKTYGSEEHVKATKKRIERYLAVELGEAAEVQVYDLAGGGTAGAAAEGPVVVEGLNIHVEEDGGGRQPVVPPGVGEGVLLYSDHPQW